MPPTTRVAEWPSIPSRIVLSASTSEAYSWLFKLLCNPGESVLIPQPSYPLFEHLTRLESVRAVPYRLEYHGRWDIDFESIAAAKDDVRAVLLVSPNNPTGSYVTPREADTLAAICRERGWAIVSDEVFADYALDAHAPATEIARRAKVLSFTLGGASKSLGLPQMKLAWTIVGGPVKERDRRPVGARAHRRHFPLGQYAGAGGRADLFRRAAPIRQAIHERVSRNLTALGMSCGPIPPARCCGLKAAGRPWFASRPHAVRKRSRSVSCSRNTSSCIPASFSIFLTKPSSS